MKVPRLIIVLFATLLMPPLPDTAPRAKHTTPAKHVTASDLTAREKLVITHIKQPNYMYDVTQAGSFTESGWAAAWKLTGNRNYAGVEAWNLGNDVAQALVAHYLHRKGGWKGKIGDAMNFSHGIVHLEGGLRNLHYVHANSTPDQWVKNNPLWFNNWTPPRWWGKE